MNAHRSRGKHLILFLIAGILFAGILFAAVFSAAKNQYWSRAYLQEAVLDLDDFGGDIVQYDSQLDEIKSAIRACNEKALPVRRDFADFFQACNEAISSFFQDVYDADVTGRLNALQIMEAVYPEELVNMVGGSYSRDFPDKLFMNAAILDSCSQDLDDGELPAITGAAFSVKLLRTVYIHEVMHFLGFSSDSLFEHFTEAVAECLNKKVMQHSGIKYESITGYAGIQGFAAQILECDPELVREVLSSGNSGMGEHFNRALEGGAAFNYAEYYDKLIGLIQQGGHEKLDTIAYYAQYLTYEYCKAVNSNAKDILSEAGGAMVSLFELRWLLNIY